MEVSRLPGGRDRRENGALPPGMVASGLACLALAFLPSSPATAQSRDVNFAVVGKHAGFEQAGAGKPKRRHYSFFSEIFLAAGTPLDEATLIRPDGREVQLRDMREAVGPSRDRILLIRGDRRYGSERELDEEWPNGEYVFRYSPPGAAEPVSLRVRLGDGPYPAPPRVWLEQNGAEAAADSVNPGSDLTVRFTPFGSGRADPREICDDMIFVILRDEESYKVDHSGRPFQGQRFMLYSDTERVIPAAALAPASRYTLSVEHATLEQTARGARVPVMSTRAVTTALEIHTLPPLPQIMDNVAGITREQHDTQADAESDMDVSVGAFELAESVFSSSVAETGLPPQWNKESDEAGLTPDEVIDQPGIGCGMQMGQGFATDHERENVWLFDVATNESSFSCIESLGSDCSSRLVIANLDRGTATPAP